MSHRVLHAIAPAETGGAERVVHMLAAGQRAAGLVPVVGGVTGEEPASHSFFAPLEAEGIATRRIAIPDRAYVREVREWRALIDAWRPDVVHTHGYRADVVAGLAAARAGVALVSTAHGFIGGDRRGRMYERVQMWSYRRGREVVAVSRPIAERLARARVPVERLHVVPNALRPPAELAGRAEARAHLGLAPDARVLGWVGRLGPEKGPDVALESLVDLPGTRLSFVGEGGLGDALAARAETLGLGDRVTFHGVVDGMARWLPAFDALVLSSRTEGTPITLLEAMHAGVPIVATRVGGVPDLLEHERHALLVEPDAPFELAAALHRLASEPGLGAELAAAARRRLDTTHAVDVWVGRYVEIYGAARAGASS